MELDLWQRGQALAEQQSARALMLCNEFTGPYGLHLSEAQAMALVVQRGQALATSGRIEFGSGIVGKLIHAFCDSPYLSQHDYTETIGALTTIFYEFKNEWLDLISDDALIHIMEQAFNGPCQGSLELLEERELARMALNLRQGHPPDMQDPLVEADRRDALEEVREHAGD